MSTFHSRLFSRADLPDLLGLVTDNARARWPAPTYLMNSDVAWRLPGSRGDLRLWYDEIGLAGYAWFDLIGPSTFDLRAEIGYDGPVVEDLFHWLAARRREFKPLVPWLIELRSTEEWERALDDDLPGADGRELLLQIAAFDRDVERIAHLSSQGFEATEHFGYLLSRSLDEPIPEPRLPEGWRVRDVGPSEFEARVAVHRAAWHRSRFSLEQYLKVRAIDVYDPSLDLVAVAPTGEFASYCIGWVDEALGVGSFEPVGTSTQWRRRGLGQQVQYEGLRRMKAKGMHSAKIGTAGFNERAYGLYTACGFELMDKERTYIKAL